MQKWALRHSTAILIASALLLGYAVAQTKSTQYLFQQWDISQPTPNPIAPPNSAVWSSDGAGNLLLSTPAQNGGKPFVLQAGGGIGPQGPAGPPGAPGTNGSGCLVGQTMDGVFTIDATGTAHFKVTTGCH
jgi:hypothetical protein